MKLVVDFLLIAGLVMISIILLSLHQNKQKELPQKLLMPIFFVFWVITFTFYGLLHQIKIIFFSGMLITEPAVFILAPLFFMYVKSLYLPSDNLVKNHRWHFLPLVIYFFLFVIPMMVSMITETNLFPFLLIFEEDVPLSFLGLFQSIYFSSYCIAGLLLLKKYKQTLKLNYSNFLEKDLNWVNYMLLGMLVILIIDSGVTIYEIVNGHFDWPSQLVPLINTVIMIAFLGNYGTAQSKILIPHFLLIPHTASAVETQKELKEKTTGHHLVNAEKQEIEALKRQLQNILENEKPYLNEDLTLGLLATLVGTTDKKMSALLNHYLKTSFYDLINNYRVEEVKQKIIDENYENYTLLAIGFECGFKSKTSFNRIFKRTTGISPSAFKKQNHKIKPKKTRQSHLLQNEIPLTTEL